MLHVFNFLDLVSGILPLDLHMITLTETLLVYFVHKSEYILNKIILAILILMLLFTIYIYLLIIQL